MDVEMCQAWKGQGRQHCSHQPSRQSSTLVASHGALALLWETWVFPFGKAERQQAVKPNTLNVGKNEKWSQKLL